jgi:hypothetical protein
MRKHLILVVLMTILFPCVPARSGEAVSGTKNILIVSAKSGELLITHPCYMAAIDDSGRLTIFIKTDAGVFTPVFSRFSLARVAVRVPGEVVLSGSQVELTEPAAITVESETGLTVVTGFQLRRPEFDLSLSIKLVYDFNVAIETVDISAEIVNLSRNPADVSRITFTALPTISANTANGTDNNGNRQTHRFFNAYDGPRLHGRIEEDTPLTYGSTSTHWQFLLAAAGSSPTFSYIAINPSNPYHQLFVHFAPDSFRKNDQAVNLKISPEQNKTVRLLNCGAKIDNHK